jgi:lysozyme
MKRTRGRKKKTKKLRQASTVSGSTASQIARHESIVTKSRKKQTSLPMVASLQLVQWTEGMDVSKNQDVDWTQIDISSINFAIIKATDGIDYVDPSFQVNWSAAGQLSALKRGAYHFFRPDDDVDAQIELIKRTVILQPTDLPLALDVENTDNRNLSPKDVPTLARLLQSLTALFNRKPILYTSGDGWTSLGCPASSGALSFVDFPLWIAYYTVNPAPNYPAPWIQWLIWQYRKDGSVGGVNKPGSSDPAQVDLDRFNGSPDGLIRLAALT